jgi:hypothetical protein
VDGHPPGRSLWDARERYSLQRLDDIAFCAIVSTMTNKSQVLGEVMRTTGTSQVDLARISGVRQPTISKMLGDKVSVSDEQLDRLLSCMGYRLEVVRRPVVPELTRSERRSWRLHRQLSTHLTPQSLTQWRPKIDRNLLRLRSGMTGEPHTSNLHEWERLIGSRDLPGIHRVLTGLDRHGVEMREVSPFGGILSEEERVQVLSAAS